MKLFIALVVCQFTKKKLQIATPKQDCWFGKQKRPLNKSRSGSKRIYRRKTWFQPVLPPPKEILEKKKLDTGGPIGRFEFPQKYRPMDIQGLSQSTTE
jgi:hypothetical protein